MESTGTYWQSLHAALQESGFQVILCNGKFTKNIKGRKSDVQDCQWIQNRHEYKRIVTEFQRYMKTLVRTAKKVCKISN